MNAVTVGCLFCGTAPCTCITFTWPNWYTPGYAARDRAVAKGAHPLGMKLNHEGTCGGCAHSARSGFVWRCGVLSNQQIIKRWKACELYELPSGA